MTMKNYEKLTWGLALCLVVGSIIFDCQRKAKDPILSSEEISGIWVASIVSSNTEGVSTQKLILSVKDNKVSGSIYGGNIIEGSVQNNSIEFKTQDYLDHSIQYHWKSSFKNGKLQGTIRQGNYIAEWTAKREAIQQG